MKISIKRLEKLGWKYNSFYGPGQESMYEKNGKQIRVGNYIPPKWKGLVQAKDSKFLKTARYILTYSGCPTTDIASERELENYAMNYNEWWENKIKNRA